MAAGKGKRMKSKLPKVLHKVAGKPMILRSIETIRSIKNTQIILVVSPRNINIFKKIVERNVDFAIQKEPKGTADATYQALKKVKSNVNTVMVVNGDDSAFYKPETLIRVIKLHTETNSVQTFLTLQPRYSTGLGRVIKKQGKVVEVVEEKDATNTQKKIKEVNGGLYVFDKSWLSNNLPKIKPSPVSHESYLVDLVKIAARNGKKISTYKLNDLSQWHGINTKKELKIAELKLGNRIHMMGIAGAGASAAAQIAKAYGYQVTGCDIDPKSAYKTNLKIKIERGHDPKHLQNISNLVISPAVLKYNPKNTEVAEAKKQKISTMTWQQFQGNFLQKNKFVIAVAGTYGKSTTTAMIAQVLVDAGLAPTCEIGATVLSWNSNYKIGSSKYYVCEADEYNDNFLYYSPDIAVILNIAWDHPDYFKTKEKVLDSFKKFIIKIKKNGVLVIPKDPDLEKLARFARSDVKIVRIRNYDNYKLSIIGDFRKENANAALTVANITGINPPLAKKTIQNFSGVKRRLEFKGKIGSVSIYDDYAVQPYTVLTTANALKEKFKNHKVVLVFEPHTFSRISIFFEDFVKNLKICKVNKILITEVYPARENGNKKELALKLAHAIGPKAKFTGSITETASYLKKRLKDYDVICSMGAGNAYKLYDKLISA